MNESFNLIANVGSIVENGRTLKDVMIKVAEETGEIAAVVSSLTGHTNYKKEVVGDVLFKPGQLYQTKDNRIIIILEVSKEDLKRGINADKTGLYGFRGFWYGRDRFKIKSYGKIYKLTGAEVLLKKDTIGMSNVELKKLLD